MVGGVRAGFLAIALAFAGFGAAAQELTVIGMGGGETVLHREDIEALPRAEMRTETEFTNGRPVFAGPRFADVLALVPHDGAETAVMVAANDYSVEIPIEELLRYEAILAHTVDGRRLSRRDKGPFWVMYPLDSHEELQDPMFNSRLIWQLVRIELK